MKINTFLLVAGTKLICFCHIYSYYNYFASNVHTQNTLIMWDPTPETFGLNVLGYWVHGHALALTLTRKSGCVPWVMKMAYALVNQNHQKGPFYAFFVHFCMRCTLTLRYRRGTGTIKASVAM